MRKVTIVVPVLITSCQVSENLNNGPLTAQINTTMQAAANANGLPAAFDMLCAIRPKDFDMASERGLAKSVA